MASGDAQRVWFPEMLEILRATWSPTTTWTELADLCARLTTVRNETRSSRGVEAPRMRCPRCGTVSRGGPSRVSIRSALFALKKEGLLLDDEFARLDRDWSKHRKAHGLDANGQEVAASRADAVREVCTDHRDDDAGP